MFGVLCDFSGESRKECMWKHINTFCDAKDVYMVQKHYAQGIPTLLLFDSPLHLVLAVMSVIRC